MTRDKQRRAAAHDFIKNNPPCRSYDAFRKGAEWADKNLWHDAHGDFLPEYDREVIVLFQEHDDDPVHLRVGFGHRPDPKGYVVRSLGTGEIETLHPKCYGTGGWNWDKVKYWLNVELPIK